MGLSGKKVRKVNNMQNEDNKNKVKDRRDEKVLNVMKQNEHAFLCWVIFSIRHSS